ncbi:LPXTG cell wall anchor domain-containing protein [Ligilactobacillus equi]|nr:LPXTG cell wall anchor domain-containing protein [Ligilactobacillus equi]
MVSHKPSQSAAKILPRMGDNKISQTLLGILMVGTAGILSRRKTEKHDE